MTDKRKITDQALDDLFADASHQTQVPKTLSARVLEDAERLQPVRRKSQHRKSTGFFEMLGGWQGLGGLVAAGCTGLWIGVSPPAAVPDPAAWLGVSDVDSAQTEAVYETAFGWDLEEG